MAGPFRDRDALGRLRRVYTKRVNPDDEYSLMWVGLNKNCEAIPSAALELEEDFHNIRPEGAVGESGRLLSLEWADTPDWYRASEHYRGWIPLERPNDNRRGAWARRTTTKMELLGPTHQGLWHLAGPVRVMVERDLAYFWSLLEDVCTGSEYDIETHTPPYFDSSLINAGYPTEADAQKMGMEARRAVLSIMGHLAWWTASVPDWMKGLSATIVEQVLELQLGTDRKRGFLISIPRDWRELNFPLLLRHSIPVYFVWGIFEARDPSFKRLDPDVMTAYLEEDDSHIVDGLWKDDFPPLLGDFDLAIRYDRYLQLKIDPFACPCHNLPIIDEDSGRLEYWVIDHQFWRRRLLGNDEKAEDLHELYHHIVVESRSERVTRVIFHRFHRKPAREVLMGNGDLLDEELIEPDTSVIRERFKGHCAPRFGQKFDPETGVERKKAIDDSDPIDLVHTVEEEFLMLSPPGHLGGHLVGGGNTSVRDDREHDATRFGREVGPRVTSPDSDHSSERREYDSAEPMAHESGWLQAMARDDWGATIDHFVTERNGRRPNIRTRARHLEAGDDEFFADMSRAGTPRRSASPEPRGRIVYPIRSRTPPPFRANSVRKDSMVELANRRARWLERFTTWGSKATFEASLWRVPVDLAWNPDVLEHGYLIISESSEFRLRYQMLTNPAIRFPRHLLELAMERGIQFAIAYKRTDCDLFRPTERDEEMSRMVTKAVVDVRAKGPRLESATAVSTVYRQYRANLGKIGDTPQARALIMRGGAASWIMRAYIGLGLVRRVFKGPSVQVSVHHMGANDSADDDCIDVTWDEVSDGDYEALFGFIPGTSSESDTYLYPTDDMLEEFSDHYYREWNPFCDKTFQKLKSELDDGRGKCRTKTEWKHYFQSSNRGTFKPTFVVNRAFIDEGMERVKGALQCESWNKRKLSDIARDIPAQFRWDF
ncbi:hypothetical protein C8R47DRAFT_1068576 [Mycena vitilis]|nr:hypothetical protein C8R47DRAFT_1068576 [Mycena vitilis]